MVVQRSVMYFVCSAKSAVGPGNTRAGMSDIDEELYFKHEILWGRIRANVQRPYYYYYTIVEGTTGVTRVTWTVDHRSVSYGLIRFVQDRSGCVKRNALDHKCCESQEWLTMI